MNNDTKETTESSPPKEPEDRSGQRGTFARLGDWLFREGNRSELRDKLEHAVSNPSSPGSDSFSEQERVMIANILRFGALRVEDVMVPRADIQAIEETATISDLLANFDTVGHSRLPVYRDTLDDPVGMVHVKDLLSWLVSQAETKSEHISSPKPDTAREPELAREKVGLKVISGGMNSAAQTEDEPLEVGFVEKEQSRAEMLASYAGLILPEDFNFESTNFQYQIKDTHMLRDVLYVPPSMPVVNLLLRMQSTHVHLALVVDEYGGTDGLVSIEDLVEEVVGDIEDEHDENHGQLITGRLETGLIASARTPIEELEEKLGVDLFDEEERDDDIDTLGGYVFSTVGRVPVRGEIISHPTGLEIEVMSADPRRIKTLKIRKKTAE
ncbi:MAG: hypothetical protein DHS20C08_17580 [Rhodomicrobium sp.]|nr:MAG: hypothetical protein DHS20C08_17580 [Rhodomicrobium sp.]